MDMVYERMHGSLEELGLTTMNSLIDSTLANAKDRTFMEVLDDLLKTELEAKNSRRMTVRLKFAGFPARKTIDDLDFKLQPTIDRKLIDELLTMRFKHNI
jgi:DNA replication protein DnaC